MVPLAVSDAIPIVLSGAGNGGVQAHRVVGNVAAGSNSKAAFIAHQCWNWVGTVFSGNGHVFIDYVLHHGAGGIVAVMAAKAHQKAADVRRTGSKTGGQQFNGVAAERDGLSQQGLGVLAPEVRVCDGLGVGRAVTSLAAVRSVASRATTAVVQMGAQNITRGCTNLRHDEGAKGEDNEDEHELFHKR